MTDSVQKDCSVYDEVVKSPAFRRPRDQENSSHISVD